MHLSSLSKMKEFRNKYLESLVEDNLNILDLGSTEIGASYKSIFDNKNWRYIGVDLQPGLNVDLVLAKPYEWKEIKSNSIDVFISGQVFEHIEFFWITLLEMARVVKPGGLVCIIVPSSGPEHRYPLDCWRFYPDGAKAMARFAEFEVLEAYTHWGGSDDPLDASQIWQDTVLICKKPVLPLFLKFKKAVKQRILHRALMLGAVANSKSE